VAVTDSGNPVLLRKKPVIRPAFFIPAQVNCVVSRDMKAALKLAAWTFEPFGLAVADSAVG